MQQTLKIKSVWIHALAIGGGFTKTTIPVTEHVGNDVHFGIAISRYFCILMKTIL